MDDIIIVEISILIKFIINWFFNSKIFYFENDCLKFEQRFKFGYEIILRDISKITLFKQEIIEEILNQIDQKNSISDEELIEKKFFEDNNFRKIKKNLSVFI